MDRRKDLDFQFECFEKKLPGFMAGLSGWARSPNSGWVRIPMAIALILGGFVGFLPILGFWMIPLGLVLVAQDVPFLRPPMARLLAWINDKWPSQKASASQASAGQPR